MVASALPVPGLRGTPVTTLSSRCLAHPAREGALAPRVQNSPKRAPSWAISSNFGLRQISGSLRSVQLRIALPSPFMCAPSTASTTATTTASDRSAGTVPTTLIESPLKRHPDVGHPYRPDGASRDQRSGKPAPDVHCCTQHGARERGPRAAPHAHFATLIHRRSTQRLEHIYAL